ncbi:spore cortex-lytic enzyme-like [Harmonia axyridis]|uniref:spore cortex-lytic enzyme-like n=1 Tax=Harmonia axyridis TaxID=115357 RepID=UPI001E278C8C|nr:spore cortex-lytic enzyme-like [Harmonia axyridis]
MRSFVITAVLISAMYVAVTEALTDREIFAKTIYGEARGEPVEGQRWVAWVIKNRARANKSYWGGSVIGDVCRKRLQFSSWNGKTDIAIGDPSTFQKILQLANSIYDAPASEDPTGGCDHFHSKKMKKYPSWIRNCKEVKTIGNHIFYKSV